MKRNQYARKERQLSSLVEKFQYQLAHPKEGSQIEKLIAKIKKLIQELAHVISLADLKKILGATAVFVGISVANQTMAQSFKPPVENPFGLVSTYYFAAPAFVDIDNDGDMDLFVGEDTNNGTIEYFENTGSANEPYFTTPLGNPFGIESIQESEIFPTLVDIDDDGDMDLFVGENFYCTIEYFENVGSASVPQFAAPEAFAFGIDPLICGFVIPSFADLDNDGDLDLLIGGEEDYGFNTQYLENIGTAANPQFAEPQTDPFGLIVDVHIAAPAFIDLDGDGDMDLLIGEIGGEGNILYFDNIGTVADPQFAAPLENPFGLSPTYQSSFIDYADLDSDGDLDLLIGEDGGSMQYFENTAATGISNIKQNVDLKLFPNPVINILNIEVEHEIEKIEILNMLGEKELSILSNTNRILLSDIKSGIYTVKITISNGNCIIRKFVKE